MAVQKAAGCLHEILFINASTALASHTKELDMDMLPPLLMFLAPLRAEVRPALALQAIFWATGPLGEEPNPGNRGSPGRPLRPCTRPKRGSQGVPTWYPPIFTLLNLFFALICFISTALGGLRGL